MKGKILLIDDEPGVQMTLTDRLTSEGYEITVRSDGIRGEHAAREHSYDLILLDLMLPGKDGFSVCSSLREDGILTPILMLTARGEDLDVVMGLRQGADDYLPKPFDMAVLLARIQALLRRAAVINLPAGNEKTIEVVRFSDYVLDRRKGMLYKSGEPLGLNTQEFRLLEFLACHPGHVLSRETILQEVWGYDGMTTTRTVDVHIAKLRGRLGESRFPRHIRTVRGRGYCFEP